MLIPGVGRVVVLHHSYSLRVIPLVDQLGDVSKAEHVAVEIQGPVAVIAQVRDQEAREGKIRALLRVSGTPQPVVTTELIESQRNDCNRFRCPGPDRMAQDLIGARLFRVEADKNLDQMKTSSQLIGSLWLPIMTLLSRASAFFNSPHTS